MNISSLFSQQWEIEEFRPLGFQSLRTRHENLHPLHGKELRRHRASEGIQNENKSRENQ